MQQLRKAIWDIVYWTFLFGLSVSYFSLGLNYTRAVIMLVFGTLTVLAYRKLKTALDAAEGMVCDESTQHEPHGAKSGAEGM